jgi:predicted ribosomally synthesized peptide with nif11-like leader
MAKKDFVKFYSEYLPQNPELKNKIDAITNEDEFAKTVLQAGPKAGFSFTEQEVREVMQASEQKVMKPGAELSDSQLEAVAGGAYDSFSTVTISSSLSTTNLQSRTALDPGALNMSTVMCCW